MTSVTDSAADWAAQRQITLQIDAQTGSTNDNAKAGALSEVADITIYLASHQTAGRGRGGNSWLDTGAGESLLMTWSIRLPSPAQAITAPRLGLCVYKAVRHSWPSLAWSLKAPNDLLLDGRKVAGLLVESVTGGDRHRLLIGFGFNILNHPRRFGEATHLTAATGGLEEGDWFRFLDEWHAQIKTALDEITKPELSETVRQDLVQALNAHPGKAYTIQRISPAGDIIHSAGQIRWTDL